MTSNLTPLKKLISLLLVFSILTLSIQVTAKERRGADLIIQRTDGQHVRGELIAVKQDSLLLMERDSGADISVEIKEIAIVTINKKSKALFGLGLGLLIGGISGALIGSTIKVQWGIYNPEKIKTTLYITLGAILGGAIGGTLGARGEKDETIQLTGKLDSEIRGILEILRKKARIKNAQ